MVEKGRASAIATSDDNNLISQEEVQELKAKLLFNAVISSIPSHKLVTTPRFDNDIENAIERDLHRLKEEDEDSISIHGGGGAAVVGGGNNNNTTGNPKKIITRRTRAKTSHEVPDWKNMLSQTKGFDESQEDEFNQKQKEKEKQEKQQRKKEEPKITHG